MYQNKKTVWESDMTANKILQVLLASTSIHSITSSSIHIRINTSKNHLYVQYGCISECSILYLIWRCSDIEKHISPGMKNKSCKNINTYHFYCSSRNSFLFNLKKRNIFDCDKASSRRVSIADLLTHYSLTDPSNLELPV